ncbi:hypothetical protein ACFQJ7_16120 [Halovenus rubra]|uniref:Uncharacterized protein n=2 Tax=Halovenus rubra TaxID=869890 RepID=A0ACC7E6Z7_9EURY|nr:hypothetical protein [Halovenus rubra]
MEHSHPSLSEIGRLSSYALAGMILLFTSGLLGVFEFIPFSAVSPDWNLGTISPVDDSVVVFVGLPLALAVTLIVRATSKEPADVTVALFATPCILTGCLALYQYYVTPAGFHWSGALSMGTTILLSFVVVADGMIEHVTVS